MTKIIIFLLGLSLVACQNTATSPAVRPRFSEPQLTPDDGAIPTQAISWLRENAIPFDTSHAGAEFQDLMPLKDIIGDARVVALGEATHGTHEFFHMKHRLLEFLVEEMGFSGFAIEAYWYEAALINEYVQSGEGDVSKLLGNLGYWPWQTQEVLELIEWMRTYNQVQGHSPVSFYGFDMQNASGAIDHLLDYLDTVDTEAAVSAREKHSCFGQFQEYNYQQSQYAQQPAPTRQQCSRQLQSVYDGMFANQRTYEALTSPDDFAFALQTARVIQQAEKMAAAAESSAIFPREWFNARDEAMAENVMWLLENTGPESRIVLWAHNGHVQTADWEYSGIRYATMGTHLRRELADQLVAVGFTFHDGAFNAIDYDAETNTYAGLRSHPAGPTVKNSIEEYLHSAQLPRLILDFRQITAESPTSWLHNPHWLRFVGATYDRASEPKDNAYVVVLPEAFDVLIYFDETRPSDLPP